MSLLKRLFGGGGAARNKAEPVDYEGFRITPDPSQEPGGYRIGARIEKGVDGETRTHQMIRADVCSALDEATALSLAKARQVIDEQGEHIFR